MSEERLEKAHEVWLRETVEGHSVDKLTETLDDLYVSGPDIQSIRHAQKNLHHALAALKPEKIYYDSLLGNLVGPIFLALSERGVVAIGFGGSEEAFLDRLGNLTRANFIRSPKRVALAAQQLREYLSGERSGFDLPLDLNSLTTFQRRVLLAVSKVPRGEVTTYGDLARQIGRPKSARAVGQALRRNPIPIVIPCHRVLASDGSLGGYTGKDGVKTKVELLRLEGVLF